ncbi:MAG TPA: GNAT family N-acetyltransferase [archaeon]|nr:GNAT family N-acetyltransferase [archaeon]
MALKTKARIRRTRKGDFKGIEALLKEARVPFANLNAGTFARFYERDKGFCFVAVKGNRVVGNVFGSFNGVSYGYISKLAVARDSRREGIATMLLQRLLREFKKAKAVWAYAIVDRNNSASFKALRGAGLKKCRWGVLVEKYPL